MLGHYTMDYKASCPKCGKKVSRWYIFGQPTIHHRCRACGVLFRPTLAGNLVTVSFLALAVLWFVMLQTHVLSPLVVIVLLLITGIVMVWLLPYIMPVRLKPETKSDDDAAS